ncbi:hypothetical protein SPI_09445 [Niveomyces insectorum RCEF 264]|uniref:Uncharacterized protein n=1 Tax=Niveomyces insectorum RCEF 264 TaxID=1081102 RepID=A0A167LUF6_9HYPO|nr:hypothetical protein SPI_09445 [Niveomyces insectorum RCEF 264]
MAETMLPRRSHDIVDHLTAEDFETASIRSAAPSYSSEAPSAHFTVPNTAVGFLPPYAAPAAGSAERAAAPGTGRYQVVSSLLNPASSGAPSRRAASAPMSVTAATTTTTAAAASSRSSATAARGGGSTAPVFANPLQPSRVGSAGRGEMPDLAQYRIPSWSTISSSPNARLYHSVALRRVAAAEHASAAAELGGLMRRLGVLERMEQEEAAASRRMASANAAAGGGGVGSGSGSGSGSSGNSNNNSGNSGGGGSSNSLFHLIEDPYYMVGQTGARRNRSGRLARGHHASDSDDALIREDRRWDWFLGSFDRPTTLSASSSRRRLFTRPSSAAGDGRSSASRRHHRLYHTFLGH